MDNSSRIIDVDINDILPNRNQPRIILNEEDDLGLTDSVKEYGVLQPIIVRAIGDKYEIIAGERRYRASVLAGKETVPVIVRNMSDKDSAEIALIENVQRKELTPIEEALSYKSILDKGYMTQEELAVKIGKSQPTIANKIRLLNLTDEVQDALLENKISERHARSLLKIKNKNQQNKMLDKIINERLTVRRTDEEIDKLGIEKEGEEDMNNEFINMPQFDMFAGQQPVQPEPVAPAAPVQPAAPQFDMFAGQQPVQPEPAAPAAPAQPAAPQFDMFAGQQPVQPEPVAPVPPAQPATPQFDMFAGQQPVQPEPAAPQANIFASPEVAPVAEVTPTVEQPEPQFDIFANQAPVAPVPPAQPAEPQFDIFASQAPAAPVELDPAAPMTEEQPVDTVAAPAEREEIEIEDLDPADDITIPIEVYNQMFPDDATDEDDDDDDESAPNIQEPVPNDVITTAPIQEEPVVQAQPVQEPIIITDYNKQYDPVMPQTQTVPTQQVDFKEVINTIRECAAKIESYGYKIDLDEFDLTNIYQAIFKIEKM